MSELFSQCYRLVYRLRTVSGVWIKGEGCESTVSEDYIPGDEVRRGIHLPEEGVYLPEASEDIHSLEGSGEIHLPEAGEGMKFSFVYPCLDGKRGVPSPVSFSYLKSDHTQVRDQLADGRREDDYDRERLLWACYMDDPGADTMISMSVRRETVSVDGRNVFVIAPGQLFSGFIDGPKEPICAIARLFKKQPEIKIGVGKEQGLGACVIEAGAGKKQGLGTCKIEAVYVEKISKEPANMQEEFIIRLNSPLPLFMPSGLYDERPDAVLSEIEGALKCPGGLSLVDVCRKTGTFYRKNQPAALCTDKGSCFRIRSKIGPVDIAPLCNFWLGKFSNDGYGEITAEAVPQNHYRKMLVLGEDI